GIILAAAVTAAGALVQASTAPARTAPVNAVRLTAISSRVHARGASLVIEAPEPVAYVASRPDPLTVLVDFRNVDGNRVTNSVTENARSPIAGVTVEASDAPTMPGSRVRIDLAQPVGHRVRSDRNSIIVDFDKPAESAPARERVAVDPIAALGLDAASSVPVATTATAVVKPAPRAAMPGTPVAPAAQTAGSATIQPASPQAPQPGTVIGTGQPAERRYTGHPVSLDFQGADLRAVLRTFAEISGLNIVIDPSVNGTVDVALRDVPWDQALDIILRANKLGYVVDGTIVRIAPLTALADEETQRRKRSDEQALAGDLRVAT